MQTAEYFQKYKGLLKQIIDTVGTPVFVTDKSVLQRKVQDIKSVFGCLLYYAVKANFNPHIIQALKEAGVDGIESISPYEIQLAKKMGFKNTQILFTGNNATMDELDKAKEAGVTVNIGSMSELKYFANKYKGSRIAIRINPGFGDGEFKQVVTGGKDSKFGILHTQIDDALKIIGASNISLIGLHCHLGSGLYNTDSFSPMVEYVFNLASKVKGIEFIDLGGGLGVRYKPSDKEIDLSQFANVIREYYEKYDELKSNKVQIILEPGKYLVAESTFLLTKITNIREQQDIKTVGVNTGFNHIVRPVLYSSYHHIINISNLHEEKEEVKVVGNICESTDVLNEKIQISKPEEGDILAILTAGAYCSSMSNLYNLRPYASEALIHDNKFSIIRKKLGFEETIGSLGFV